MTARAGLVAALISLSAGPATAHELHLGVEALTDFPVQVGGKVWAELPLRLRVDTSLGVLPGPYVDAINAVLVAANVYSRDEANLIRSALQSSLVWRLHAGWRPFARHGFYFMAGYGLVTLGGSASTAELISAVTGRPIPPDAALGNHTYRVASTLHMIDAEVGWQWILWKGLTLRAALGFAGTLAAQSTVTPAFTPRAPQLQATFTAAAADYLDATFTSYVFTPVVTLAAGWRFL